MKFDKLSWNKSSFSTQQCHSHHPHLLQLHQLLTFSCFSKPNPLPSPPTYKNPPSIPDLTSMVINFDNQSVFIYEYIKLQGFIIATDLPAKKLTSFKR